VGEEEGEGVGVPNERRVQISNKKEENTAKYS
jgi:hypothetical protein